MRHQPVIGNLIFGTTLGWVLTGVAVVIAALVLIVRWRTAVPPAASGEDRQPGRTSGTLVFFGGSLVAFVIVAVGAAIDGNVGVAIAFALGAVAVIVFLGIRARRVIGRHRGHLPTS